MSQHQNDFAAVDHAEQTEYVRPQLLRLDVAQQTEYASNIGFDGAFSGS